MNDWFGNVAIVSSACFMKNKNQFENGEMGQAGVKRDETWGEVGQL